MSNEDFLKITTALTKGLHPFTITSEGVVFNDDFIDRIRETEELFRSKVLVPINETLGLHNWAVHFSEHPREKPKFFGNVYADTENDSFKVMQIIKNNLPDIEFTFEYKGDISIYKQTL